MRNFLKFALLLAATAFFAASPARAQSNVSGNVVTITQGGNVANVDAGNALKVNMGELGGTALSGAQVVDVANTAWRVNCVIGCGGAGGTSLGDEGTFTQGTTSFTPVGGFYNTSITNLLSGQGGAVQLTNTRHMFVNVADALPTGANTIGAVTQASGPWTSNVTQFGGTNISTGTGAGGAGIPRVTISNDSSLAANQSVNVAQINGVTPLMGNGVTGTGSQRVTIASDNTAFSVNATLQAGTNLIGSASPNWGCGTTAFNQALVAVPTSVTAATSTTTCLSAATACNTNASAQTFTLEDNQGTPIVAVNAASIPALSCYTYPFYGAKFTSGIKWLAGGTGVTGALIGVQ